MLNELIVEDLGVFERAEVALGDGSVALTGETGAGKTLVITALALLLGERADKGLLRTGAAEARVEAGFTVPRGHPAAEAAAAGGLLDDDPADEDELGEVHLVLSRCLTADGRTSKARINGRLTTVGTLGEIGRLLVEIAGQHQHARLADVAEQRRLLDRAAGTEQLADQVAAAVRRAAELRRRTDEWSASARDRARELDLLRYEIAEITGVAPVLGEDEQLLAEAKRLEHAEQLSLALKNALDALRDEGGAEETLDAAESALGGVLHAEPRLAPLVERLRAVQVEVTDIAAEASGLVSEPDADALTLVQARLADLAHLKRKYGDTIAEVLQHVERISARAAALESAAADEGSTEAAARAAEDEARTLAEHLSQIRRDSGASLSRAIGLILSDLALPGARFEVSLEDRPLFEGGIDDVSFLVSFNTGAALQPIAKVASGGELSRLALALHLHVTGEGERTMVFDEVDAGVGGEAARAVGSALAELAHKSAQQVIVVTHLPQVAAFAEHHLKVFKQSGPGATRAEVTTVAGDARVEELARMLAGLPSSEVGQEHARELLQLAARAEPAV